MDAIVYKRRLFLGTLLLKLCSTTTHPRNELSSLHKYNNLLGLASPLLSSLEK